jgi:type VI protein secretion system component Hcp
MGKVAGGMSYGTALEIVQSALQQSSGSASDSGSGGGVSENVSFSFTSIKWVYTQQ